MSTHVNTGYLALGVEDHKEILPLAALRDDTSPITEKHVESKGDITTFTLDSKSALGFSTNCIASLRHYKQKHAFKSNDDKLQYLSDGRGNDWKDVIGDLFRFPGGECLTPLPVILLKSTTGTTYITSTCKCFVQLLRRMRTDRDKQRTQLAPN